MDLLESFYALFMAAMASPGQKSYNRSKQPRRTLIANTPNSRATDGDGNMKTHGIMPRLMIHLKFIVHMNFFISSAESVRMQFYSLGDSGIALM